MFRPGRFPLPRGGPFHHSWPDDREAFPRRPMDDNIRFFHHPSFDDEPPFEYPSVHRKHLFNDGAHFAHPQPPLRHAFDDSSPFSRPRLRHGPLFNKSACQDRLMVDEPPFLGPTRADTLPFPPHHALSLDDEQAFDEPMHVAMRIRNRLMQERPRLPPPPKRIKQDPAELINTPDLLNSDMETKDEKFYLDDFTGELDGVDFTAATMNNKQRMMGQGVIGRSRGKSRGTGQVGGRFSKNNDANMSVLSNLEEKLDQATAAKLGLDYDAVQTALKSAKNSAKKINAVDTFTDRSQDRYNSTVKMVSRFGSGNRGFGTGARGLSKRGNMGIFAGKSMRGRGVASRGTSYSALARGYSLKQRARVTKGNGKVHPQGGICKTDRNTRMTRMIDARGRGAQKGSKPSAHAKTIRPAINNMSMFLNYTGVQENTLNITPKHVFNKKPLINYDAVSQDLGAYMSYLKLYPICSDVITTIEGVRNACNTKMLMSYIVEELMKHKDKTVYTGVLSIGGLFLARSVGTIKADVKLDTYRMAYELLTTKNVSDILKLKDPGAEAIKKELRAQFGLTVKVEAQHTFVQQIKLQEYDSNQHLMTGTVMLNEEKNIDIEQQLKVLGDRIRGTDVAVVGDQTVCYLDSYILQSKLTPVLLIRCINTSPETRTVHADLYINHFIIATGSASTKKDAQIAAYRAAWDTLCETQAWRIVKYFTKADPYQYTGSDLLDILIKGSTKMGVNNLRELYAHQVEVFQNWRQLSDLIIVDWHFFALNRKLNAMHILKMSALASGLFMEWSFEKRQCPMTLRHAAGCHMKLQREVCGYAVCSSKWYACNEAALSALRKFYVDQPIIAVDPITDYTNAIPWHEFVTACDAWVPNNVSEPEGVTEFEKSKIYLYLLHLLRQSFESKVFQGVLLQDAPDDFRKDVNRVWYERGNMIDLATFENHLYMHIIHNQEIRPVYETMIEANIMQLGHYRIIRSTDINDVY